MVKLALSYEMRVPAFGPPGEVLYAAALDQSEWADRLGFESVVLSEHHTSPDGYMPSPLIMASAIGARTADAYAPIAPRLYEIYLEELATLGKPAPDGGDPGVAQSTAVVAVSDDPDRTWNAIERNLMHDAAVYGAWTGGRRGSMFAQI